MKRLIIPLIVLTSIALLANPDGGQESKKAFHPQPQKTRAQIIEEIARMGPN